MQTREHHMSRSMATVFTTVFVCSFLIAVFGNAPHLQQYRNTVYGEAENTLNETGLGSCSCERSRYTCGCCIDIHLPKSKQKFPVCVQLKYIPAEVGIAVVVTVNGEVVYVKTVSARNPPPICFGVPYLEDEASVCLELYDMDVSAEVFSGCARVLIQIESVFTKKFKIGCFSLPIEDANEIEHKY